LRASAFAGKKLFSSGDDDSGTYGGQVLCMSNTVGDLANGSYMMKEQTTTKERKIWL
jgi:hypothetical protein